jgi:hypothetical protein
MGSRYERNDGQELRLEQSESCLNPTFRGRRHPRDPELRHCRVLAPHQADRGAHPEGRQGTLPGQGKRQEPGGAVLRSGWPPPTVP